jgi:hypothetical protein
MPNKLVLYDPWLEMLVSNKQSSLFGPVRNLRIKYCPLSENIRLRCKRLAVANTLAYCDAELITALLAQAEGVPKPEPGNTQGGSIAVSLTSCWTGLESAV